MVDEARGRVPGAWFAVADVTAAAPTARRRRVRAAAARPSARSGGRARALGGGAASAGSDRVRGAGAVSQRRSAVRPLRGRGHRGRRRARRDAVGRPRARRAIRPAASACSTVSSSTRCASVGPPRCSGATRRRGEARSPTPPRLVDGLRALEAERSGRARDVGAPPDGVVTARRSTMSDDADLARAAIARDARGLRAARGPGRAREGRLGRRDVHRHARGRRALPGAVSRRAAVPCARAVLQRRR